MNIVLTIIVVTWLGAVVPVIIGAAVAVVGRAR